MKIAPVILHADPARGGAERYTIEPAAALARAGDAVALVRQQFRGSSTRRAQGRAAGARPDAARCVIATSSIRSMRICRGALRRRACHAPGAPLRPVSPARRAGRRGGARGRPCRRFSTRAARRWPASSAALLSGPRSPRVLCLSQYVKQTLRNYYTLSDAQLPILFNAVDTSHFAPRNDEPPRRTGARRRASTNRRAELRPQGTAGSDPRAGRPSRRAA